MEAYDLVQLSTAIPPCIHAIQTYKAEEVLVELWGIQQVIADPKTIFGDQIIGESALQV